MNLTLIRHTSVNVPKGMIYGQTNVELNASFESEFLQIQNQLKTPFDIVYSSPSSRCKVLANRFSKNIHVDNRLMELNFGTWEGKYWTDIDQSPEAKIWFDNYISQKCPKGESFIDLQHRIEQFYNEIKKQNLQNMCVLTHAGPIRAFMAIIEKINPIDTFKRTINYGEILQYKV